MSKVALIRINQSPATFTRRVAAGKRKTDEGYDGSTCGKLFESYAGLG